MPRDLVRGRLNVDSRDADVVIQLHPLENVAAVEFVLSPRQARAVPELLYHYALAAEHREFGDPMAPITAPVTMERSDG